MTYKLIAGDLANYVVKRFTGTHLNIKLSRDGKSVVIRLGSVGSPHDTHITPEIIEVEGNPSRLEISVTNSDNKPFSDFPGFLGQNVDENQIFQRGNRLYSPEREKELTRNGGWKSVLKRISSKDKMVCEVIDTKVSKKRLERIYYEYMIRPIMAYIFPHS